MLDCACVSASISPGSNVERLGRYAGGGGMQCTDHLVCGSFMYTFYVHFVWVFTVLSCRENKVAVDKC